VIIIPYFDVDRILHAAETRTETLWWLLMMPGMIEDMIAGANAVAPYRAASSCWVL
jgi:hypothetical protein